VIPAAVINQTLFRRAKRTASTEQKNTSCVPDSTIWVMRQSEHDQGLVQQQGAAGLQRVPVMTGESFFSEWIVMPAKIGDNPSCAGVSVFTHSTGFLHERRVRVVRRFGAYSMSAAYR